MKLSAWELDENEPLIKWIGQFNSIRINTVKEHVGKCKQSPKSND